MFLSRSPAQRVLRALLAHPDADVLRLFRALPGDVRLSGAVHVRGLLSVQLRGRHAGHLWVWAGESAVCGVVLLLWQGVQVSGELRHGREYVRDGRGRAGGVDRGDARGAVWQFGVEDQEESVRGRGVFRFKVNMHFIPVFFFVHNLG